MNHEVSPAKVYIGDRSQRMRGLIRQICCLEKDQVSEFPESSALVKSCQANPPDCVVLDEDLDSGNLLALIRRLHAAAPRCRIILLASELNAWLEESARNAGAWICVSKDDLRALRELVHPHSNSSRGSLNPETL